ncbi:MAG: hypothetical protein EHM36_09690 [Deltaproteobacteria bacterium]|nr:MAG: hypothetical protein EHM36_09690 [Deltaproteobacteria bacterium]
MPTPNRECGVCGKPFYVSPGHLKAGWGKYCSTDCKAKAYRGSGSPRWMEGLNVAQCKNCGIFFHCKPSHIANGEGKYCSRKCYLEGKGKLSMWCVVCGKEILKYPSHIKNSKTDCCSKECRVALDGQRKKQQIARFGRIKTYGGAKSGGKRDDLGGLYVRSSWEANYARYLNWLQEAGVIMRWEFEPDTFEFPVKRGARFYTPDFKVFYPDGTITYHEIKGYLDQRSRTKLKRMATHHPDIVVRLIDQPEYRRIGRKMKRVISHWE